MAYNHRHTISIANVRPIRQVMLSPDRLQDPPTIVQRSGRAHLRPGNDIEDHGPLLIRPRLIANDVNGELLFTGAQPAQDRERFVDVLLHSHGLVD